MSLRGFTFSCGWPASCGTIVLNILPKPCWLEFFEACGWKVRSKASPLLGLQFGASKQGLEGRVRGFPPGFFFGREGLELKFGAFGDGLEVSS